jgi:glycosyltransferase involved in cell wall biosynthesis
LHDLQFYYYPHCFSPLQLIYKKIQSYHAAFFSNYILTESNIVKKDIVHFLNADDRKVHVHPLCPLNFKYKHIPSKKFSAQTPLDQQINFLYPSRPFPHKNHIRLVSAMSHINFSSLNLDLIHLYLTISEDSSLFSYLSSLAASNVILHATGYLSDEELQNLMQTSSAFVLPSLHESISIPVIEAQILNKPVLVPNTREFPFQSGPHSYFYDPLSTLDTRNTLTKFIRDYQMKTNSSLSFNAGNIPPFHFSSFTNVTDQFLQGTSKNPR